MSMDNYACHADTVEIDFVKQHCPIEYEDFRFALNNGEVSFDSFCYSTSIQDELETEEENKKFIEETFDTLCKAFEKATGLELGCVHHEAEDRADDLDGGAFSVDGVYSLTEAGKKYEKSIERKFWTTFG